jgi:hypothetical protein
MGLDLGKVDLFHTIAGIRARGGAIFYDRVPGGTTNATSAGTGTARTSISSTYTVPSAAAEIIAISPGLAPTAAAVAKNDIAYHDIQGTSFKRQPQQVLSPVASVYLSVGSQRTSPQEWYAVKAKVVAGDQYDWGVTPLVANSGNMKAWTDVMYSTIPSNELTIYSQVSAVTAFLAAGNTTGGSLTLTAAAELYELATVVAPEAAGVAGETQIMSTNAQCNALDPIQSFNYGQDPPAVIGTTSGDTQVNQISRYLCPGNRFKVPNPVLNFTHTLLTATTNNLNTANMARYVSFA